MLSSKFSSNGYQKEIIGKADDECKLPGNALSENTRTILMNKIS